MNRKELIRRVAEELRTNDRRKPVMFPKRTFHISDDDGYTKDFVVHGTGRGILYTIDDVETILDACVEVIEGALRSGDSVSVRGFGTIGLAYKRLNPNMKMFGSNIEIGDRAVYVPKFVAGAELRNCGKIYELSLQDGNVSKAELPSLVEESDEDDGEIRPYEDGEE